MVGAALAVTYPLFKRFFPLPQFYLGVAFSWGVPMAFNAQTGTIPRVAWIIFFAGIIWAAIYDTMYAMVDRDDDLKIGVKSSAIVFGDMDKLIIGMLQALMLFALYLVGTNMEFGYWYNMGLAGAGVFFAYQQWLIRDRKPEGCFKAFLNNHYVGLRRVHRHTAASTPSVRLVPANRLTRLEQLPDDQPIDELPWPGRDRPGIGCTQPEAVTDAVIEVELGGNLEFARREIEPRDSRDHLGTIVAAAQQEQRWVIRLQSQFFESAGINQRREIRPRTRAVDFRRRRECRSRNS